MKVLHLSSSYPRWPNDSIPSFVHNLARHQSAQIDTHILAPHHPGSQKQEFMDNVEVHRFQYAPTNLQLLAYGAGILSNLKKNKLIGILIPLFLCAQIYHLLKLHKRYKYDLIHCHWVIPQGISIYIASLFWGKNAPKILVTAHGSDIHSLTGNISKWLKTKILRRVDHVTAVSKPLRNSIVVTSGIAEKKVTVLPMGVDLSKQFTPGNKDTIRAYDLIYVGRLVPSKGVHTLIKACAKIRKTYPLLKVVIIGDGPEKNTLKHLQNELKLITNIEFKGALSPSEVPSHLKSAKCAVFPTTKEGLGLSIIEAMGCGCVTIASDIPPLNEIIEDNKSGRLFEENNVDQLTEIINEVLENQDERNRISTAARRKVCTSFDWPSIAEQHIELYKKIAEL